MVPELAWVFAHTGNYVAVASAGDTPVASAIGFRGTDDRGDYLHSHIAGVLPAWEGSNIGFACPSLRCKLRKRERLLRRRHMPLRRAVQQCFLGQSAGGGEAEWLEQLLAQYGIPALAGQHLDQPAEDGVSGVAVGHRCAERMVLLQPCTGGDVFLHAVIATAGVQEQVAVDSGRVSAS